MRRKPLVRHRRRRESNIQIVLNETGWECVEWIHLAHGCNKRRVVEILASENWECSPWSELDA